MKAFGDVPSGPPVKSSILRGIVLCVTLWCSVGLGQPADVAQEPAVANAVELATCYLRDAVGAEIFARDFRQVGWSDRKKIKNLRRVTAVAFLFAPPASEWVDVRFEVSVRDDGTCSMPPDWIVPRCVEMPERCLVDIYRGEAVEIAEGFGWQPGDEPWDVELRTMKRFEGFVWVVTRRSGPSSQDVLVINAYTGDVLEEHNVMWVD